MKKKTVANLIMVAVILVIAAAGILGVGYIQGWFDAADGTQAILRAKRGVTTLMRDGVSYPVENDTVLRTGDQIKSQNGATAVICFGNDQIILGEKVSLAVSDPAADSFCAEVHTGEAFIHCDFAATVRFDGRDIPIRQATVLLSVRSGAQSVSVLRGTVGNANAGQILQFIGGEETVGTLALASLNDFAITQIRSLNDSSLCFTAENLDRLAAERQQALQELINGQTQPSTSPTDPTTSTESTDPTQNTGTSESTKPNAGETTKTETTAPPDTTIFPEATTPTETTTLPETTAPTETTAPSETVPPATMSCTIAIYCDTILDNMGDLEPGKAEFVPSDGVILRPVTVNFSEGETVFDVLKRVCDRTGIQLEYSWTPLYDSYYVEGINNLYEFDCGFESGWMYKVNGWFPNYGCSSYTLKDGDVIVWAYTCKGLGTDVGAPRMD